MSPFWHKGQASVVGSDCCVPWVTMTLLYAWAVQQLIHPMLSLQPSARWGCPHENQSLSSFPIDSNTH